MKLTRRTVLATAALAGLVVVVGGRRQSGQLASARRLLTDEILLPHCKPFRASGRIVLSAGRFIDSSFVRTLPCGAYAAYLTPANELLLLEICRELRIATTSSSHRVLFEIEAGERGGNDRRALAAARLPLMPSSHPSRQRTVLLR